MHWSDLWIPGEPILAKILRPLVVYAFLVISLRLAGKRELAQLNPFDLVVLLTLSNTVQNAIIGNDNSITGGVIGAISLLVVNYAVVRFLYRHERIDRFVEGDPVVLIEILSPSNEVETRSNVWAYMSIPTVQEILVVHSTRIEAELLRRAPDGSWPGLPARGGPVDALVLASIDFSIPLTALYRTTTLAQSGGSPP